MTKLHVGDDVYDWDMDHLLIHEARKIKEQTGMAVRPWLDSLNEMDPDAIAAAVYLARSRAGLKVRYTDLEILDIGTVSFKSEPKDDRDDELEKAAQEAADPTPPVAAAALVATAATNGTSTSMSESPRTD